MYFLQSEQNPPHIHAIYNDDVAAIDFVTGDVLEGYLLPKAFAMMQEWLGLYKDDFQELWELNESTLRKAIVYGKFINGVDV